jgi:carotenoid cleavage dioxygenase-like enzyme
MIVTDQWYILFDCPITMDYRKAFVGYPMGENSLGNTIIEDRSRPPMFRMFPRPGKNNRKPVVCTVSDMWAYAYHHVNGFDLDETGTKVVFDTITWSKFELYFEDIINPDGKGRFPRTKMTRFMIDTETGTATSTTLDNRPAEAPTVAPDATGVPYKHAYMTTSSCHAGDHWHDGCSNSPLHSLTKVSMDSMAPDAQVTEDSWVPDDTSYVGEPLFVPRPNAKTEDDGWLLMTVHQTEGPAGPNTQVAIVDAQRVSDGPVAKLQLPTYVPIGVHGSFTEHYILGPDETSGADKPFKNILMESMSDGGI